MSESTGRPISAAFARVALRTLVVAAFVVVIGFAIAAERLLHRQAADAAVEQAKACAAALSPGPNGDLSDSFSRLRSRFDHLVAVAPLTPSGEIQTIYADSPVYHAAVTDAAGGPLTRPLTTTTADGRHERLWGVTVALNGHPSPTALRAVFLLQRTSHIGSWLRASAALAVLVGTALCVCLCVLKRWFDRGVVDPLRSLGRFGGKPDEPATSSPPPYTGGWSEMETIAEKLRELARRTRRSESRAREVQHEAKQEVRRHEKRLDNRLRRAEDRAATDPLTGLCNRRFLDQELEPLFTQQRTRGRDLALIMMDVDNFKALNDAEGHEAGDKVLRFLGELVRAAIRESDHAVRYGGDEFLLLLPNVNARQAAGIAERVVKLFRQYAALLSGATPLSLSAGVVTMKPDPCASGHELMSLADKALYAAKSNGKNAVGVCPTASTA